MVLGAHWEKKAILADGLPVSVQGWSRCQVRSGTAWRPPGPLLNVHLAVDPAVAGGSVNCRRKGVCNQVGALPDLTTASTPSRSC